jgi:hypothetical protein
LPFEQSDKRGDDSLVSDLQVAVVEIVRADRQERRPAVHDDQFHRCLGRLPVIRPEVVRLPAVRDHRVFGVGRQRAQHPHAHAPGEQRAVHRHRRPRRRRLV